MLLRADQQVGLLLSHSIGTVSAAGVQSGRWLGQITPTTRGKPMKERATTQICRQCGKQLSVDDVVCPGCDDKAGDQGTPVDSPSRSKLSRSSAVVVLGLLAVIGLVLLGVFGSSLFQKEDHQPDRYDGAAASPQVQEVESSEAVLARETARVGGEWWMMHLDQGITRYFLIIEKTRGRIDLTWPYTKEHERVASAERSKDRIEFDIERQHFPDGADTSDPSQMVWRVERSVTLQITAPKRMKGTETWRIRDSSDSQAMFFICGRRGSELEVPPPASAWNQW